MPSAGFSLEESVSKLRRTTKKNSMIILAIASFYAEEKYEMISERINNQRDFLNQYISELSGRIMDNVTYEFERIEQLAYSMLKSGFNYIPKFDYLRRPPELQ